MIGKSGSELRQLQIAATLNLGHADTTDLKPWTDKVLDSISFKVLVSLPFTTLKQEPEVALKFEKIGSNMLSPWVVTPGRRYYYNLPKLADQERITVSVAANR